MNKRTRRFTYKPLDVRVTVEHLPPKRWWQAPKWVLRQPLYFEAIAPNDMTFIVNAGFKSDAASIPRCLWWLFSPTGKHIAASILHDYLYAVGNREFGMTRYSADMAFYEVMRDSGVIWWRAKIMYYAVRLCGERHFNRS